MSRRSTISTRYKGFTLIELIVVIGILAILTSFAISAINPARQFAQARNAQRYHDTEQIYNAITNQAGSSRGDISTQIPTEWRTIGNTNNPALYVNLTSLLVPAYMSAIPKDPRIGSEQNTGYRVVKNGKGVVIVCADGSELGLYICHGGDPFTAIRFNGIDNYVELNSNFSSPTTGYGGNDVTVEAWINVAQLPTPGQKETIVCHQGPYGFCLYLFNNAGTQQVTFEGSTGAAIANIPLTANAWHHIAGVKGYNETSLALYIDGQQKATGESTDFYYANAPLTIGRDSYGSGFFNGILDEVRLSFVKRYTGNFTPPQAPFIPDAQTVGLWHFEEGRDAITKDSTANHFDGVLFYNPQWVTYKR